MKRKNFSIHINASRDAVWKALWDNTSYNKWTSVFAEGSHAVTDWKQGSKVLFLDGKGEGMVSRIETLKPNEFMSFEHLGTVKNGVEDTDSAATKEWSGAHENYTLSGENDGTKLSVEMDITDEFLGYFSETFPKALNKVKELAEEAPAK